ncbi:MAG: polyprenyl synthetase [Acidobacteria bacterium RIFCSPLOWO2_12_FULL_54_10]|nr:MAG: polyprenyl synthetase [Acidobacteria bacterium RIFCSPLOWO2_12_FULL_54_10]
MTTNSSVSASLPLKPYLEQQRLLVEAELGRLVPPESATPPSIHRAMRYSLFAGGKRIRPIFCLAAAQAVSPAPVPDIATISSVLELVHTYSLIHDDLPALDNDDYRRGRLTCHKVFGEATAILAGDALLTLAFEVLTSLPNTPPAIAVALAAELARSAGTIEGMIGGQVADMEASSDNCTPEILQYIHRSKTAALFRASVCMGAIAAQANAAQLAAMARFGLTAGLAFQVVDDMLDVESSSEQLGKTAGKDVAQKKVTYPAVHGLERSRQIAAQLAADAGCTLEPFGERAARLKELADFLIARKA